MFEKPLVSLPLKLSVLGALILSGCIATTFPHMRAETAQRIAAPAWMIKRDISAEPFTLRSYERIHNRGGIAHLYIEGEGSEFDSPGEWKNNPTPKDPIALHLASKDRADNVIYIARPCQYTGMASMADECEKKYWMEDRFSEEVVKSFSAALDDIARRYDITGFHLIGYSGGGAIATLLAPHRKDILSIRTVAGILDHKTQREETKSSPLTGSLNPSMEAVNLTKVPQYHFIGGQDNVVPPAVLHSYLQSMPPTTCVQSMLVQEAAYADGWVNKWPELLKIPATCYAKATPEPILMPEEMPATSEMQHFTTREKPVKP